jgi:brefeldin A-resistance guanine nucleotide exchange factor 1
MSEQEEQQNLHHHHHEQQQAEEPTTVVERKLSASLALDDAPDTQPRSNTSSIQVGVQCPPSILHMDVNTTAFSQIPPHTATRVIKGEIHNVLTIMRADHRYVSPLRFEEELVEHEEHPLLAKFRDLHATLCAWESSPQDHLPDALVYLPPFCEAIRGRDISASITGAALSALHKFLLYGFLTHTPHAQEGMELMSNSLLNCTFEESHPSAGGPAKFFESTGTSPLDMGSSRGRAIRRTVSEGPRAIHVTTPPVQQPRDAPNTARTVVGTTLLHDDEQVVLKLLELSALVVRSSLHPFQPLLSTDLIVGLLDTCLHVSHRAKRASPLLKSAAADALGQIVLQVFSTITSPTSSAIGRSNTNDTMESADFSTSDINTSPLLETRKEILLKLTNLLNPQQNSDAACATSLSLVNIAFETLREEFTQPEIGILQNDFCKYLLQWSTTHDLMILNLTLRVIFNLFQSMRKPSESSA